jgi:hypothetical protein
VYLPLSSSSPIMIGGMVRYLVDRKLRKRIAHKELTEAQIISETDRSPGVLLASGYIAGGAIAGIAIAFTAGALGHVDRSLQAWASAHNAFYAGPWSNLLSLIPFAILLVTLYFVGIGRMGEKQ